MTEARITTLLIGILFVGLLASGFGIFISDLNNLSTDYTTYESVSYDNSSLDKYNKLSEIQNLTGQISDNVQDAQPGTESEQDVVGSFFTNAYTSVKTFFQSATYTFTLSNSAIGDAANSVGGNSVLIKNAQVTIYSILVITFVIGIGLYIIFKVRV